MYANLLGKEEDGSSVDSVYDKVDNLYRLYEELQHNVLSDSNILHALKDDVTALKLKVNHMSNYDGRVASLSTQVSANRHELKGINEAINRANAQISALSLSAARVMTSSSVAAKERIKPVDPKRESARGR